MRDKEIIVERGSSINHEKLNEEMTALLGSDWFGNAERPNGVVVVTVRLNMSNAKVAQARQAVMGHDASLLTSRQQAKKDRQANLDTSRGEHPNEIDLSLYSGSDPLIQQLARRIQWLEREVRILRNGN